MRYLMIKRAKRFLGCLSKLKIYIQDPTATKPVINGTPCRLLGSMKNGEEVCFEIPNEPCRVFVITDILSRNIISELIDIPMGEEDVFLTGKCEYGTLGTVMFRFDQIFSQAQLDNRKKGGKNMLVFLAVCVIIGVIMGVGSSLYEPPLEPQVFVEDNMEITLTNHFWDEEYEGYAGIYYSDDMNVYIVRDDFTSYEGLEDYTLEEYIDLVIEINEFATAKVYTENDMVWYENRVTEDGEGYYFYSYVYKADDAFWYIQFCVLEENKDELKDTVLQYAKSVKFN